MTDIVRNSSILYILVHLHLFSFFSLQHSRYEVDSQCCRFSVDPGLTGYEVLRNLIARAFDLKGQVLSIVFDRYDSLIWGTLICLYECITNLTFGFSVSSRLATWLVMTDFQKRVGSRCCLILIWKWPLSSMYP